MKAIVLVTSLFLMALAVACAPSSTPVAPQPTAAPRPTRSAQPTPTPIPPTITPIPLKPTPAEPAPRLPVEARSHKVHEVFRSSSLEGNLLGTATTRTFDVFLPASYDTSDKRYPVIYALPLWTTGNAADFGLPDALGWWVKDGKMPEAIIVDVDMHSVEYVGDFYQSNPVVGDWPGYIAEDLVAYIDGKYRTLPKPASRALVGLMDCGGHGALLIGLRRPDVFGVVAAMAPGIGAEPFLRDCAVKAYFVGTGHMWAPKWACQQLAVALSYAFAANSDTVPFAPQPVVLIEDGTWRLVPEVWEQAERTHPSYALEDYKNQTARLNAMLFVHSATDQAENISDVRNLVKAMIDAGIPVDYRGVITSDEWGHHFWDNDMLMDFLSKQLAAE
jgi:hypothetical protein